ncbi:sialidase family protein [Sediminicurvatus halobius]|uniref:Uncharacterized protein n=1 Tax=Sediminicurvatus halobius TaxID=2182432 RepID=A0A2U2MY82_9GAMM|nr:sialidase family protein [Spiribacter halobius]PWG61777.1 hypothetical protein DEM34_15030 [Spiribacter halobius]UEX76788.1 glycoside hydrolase [Spiribacter halobius]
MPQQFLNNWASTLAAAVASTDTAITVDGADASLLGTPSAENFYLLTIEVGDAREIVKVTARSGSTLTVERGQEGTVAQAWAAGAAVELRLTAGALSALQQAGGGGGAPETFLEAQGVIGTSGKVARVLNVSDNVDYSDLSTVSAGLTMIAAAGGVLWVGMTGSGLYEVAEDFSAVTYKGEVGADGATASYYQVREYQGELFIAARDVGFSRSTDGGATWTWVGISGSVEISDVAFDGTTYLAVDEFNKLWSSTDLTTWTEVSIAYSNYIADQIIWDGSQFLFAENPPNTGDHYLWRSPDGQTWSSSILPPHTVPAAPQHYAANGILFIAYNRDFSQSEPIYSTDGGDTWTKCTINTPGSAASQVSCFGQAAVDSEGAWYLMATDGSILRSTDGAATFNPWLSAVCESAEHFALLNDVIYTGREGPDTSFASLLAFDLEGSPLRQHGHQVVVLGDVAGVGGYVYAEFDGGDFGVHWSVWARNVWTHQRNGAAVLGDAGDIAPSASGGTPQTVEAFIGVDGTTERRVV